MELARFLEATKARLLRPFLLALSPRMIFLRPSCRLFADSVESNHYPEYLYLTYSVYSISATSPPIAQLEAQAGEWKAKRLSVLWRGNHNNAGWWKFINIQQSRQSHFGLLSSTIFLSGSMSMNILIPSIFIPLIDSSSSKASNCICLKVFPMFVTISQLVM